MKTRTRVVVALLVGVALIGAALLVRARVGRVPPESAAPAVAMLDPLGAAGDGAPARAEVTIDARRQQLIGVRTTSVRRTSIVHETRAVGIVRYDETRRADINSRVDGWVRDLRADYTGRPVTRGETLFTLYSPSLLAAQQEYLLALRGHTQAAVPELPFVRDYSTELHQAARERLLRWDLTDADIRALEERGRALDVVPFRSTASGIIVDKVAVEGMRVMEGQTLFRVADLSVVWVDADVPEQDMALARIGQQATITFDAYPQEPFAARATYVYPTVTDATRTARVRFELPNPSGRLKPGMFATVILTGRDAPGLTVPTDAVLETGGAPIVFVALGEGRFEPRAVTVGRRTREEVAITSGLVEGEEVATGAAFFLDSESQMRAAVQGYEAPPDVAADAAAERLAITFRPQTDPPRSGENTFEVTVRDPSGTPVDDADVTVTFFMAAMPSMNMPAMRNQAVLPAAGGGLYRGSGQLMTPGRWDVTVEVSQSGQRRGGGQFSVVAR